MRLLTIVTALAASWTFAASAQSYVYWTNAGPGIANDGTTVGRADNDGSAVRHDFTNSGPGPAGMAVDGSYVYWANSGQNSIGRARLDGTQSTPLFIPHATVSGAPYTVATDGAH